MPIFKSTTDDDHWHLLYIDPKTPTDGLTSEDGAEPHRHMMQILPGQPPVFLPWSDPSTGEEHFHVIAKEDIKFQPSKKDGSLMSEKNKTKTMTELLELFRQSKSDESGSREESRLVKRYAKGEQWTDSDKTEMESKGRPALTMDMISPMLDLLSGYARQNRFDWKWHPVETSDAGLADLFNFISKHVAKRTNMETEEIDVFDEMVMIGRSFFEVVPDFTKNPAGEVRISHFPSQNAYLLPHIKKDMSDCDGFFKIKDISLSDAKTLLPEMAKKFDGLFVQSDGKFRDPDITVELTDAPDGYGSDLSTETVDPALYRDTVVDIGRKAIRLVEFERREYRTANFLMIPGEQQAIEVSSQVAKKADSLDPLVRVIEAQASRIRVTYAAGPFVIKDGYPVRPLNEFSLVPVYAKKDGCEYWGKVRNVLDCQDEINKRHSQATDILNKVASYGYLYDSETFDTPEDRDRFINQSSTPGFILRVKNLKNPPMKMEGAKFPGEIYQMEQAGIQMFRLISNVNLQSTGQATGSESNVSKLTQIRQAMTGNEFLFDNFTMAKRRVGKIAMGWAKEIFTPDRVARLLLSGASAGSNKEEPMEIGGKSLAVKMPDPDREYWLSIIAKMWTDADIMDYDVEVGEGALSTTARQAIFNQWLEAAKTGVAVPAELLIDYSDLPNKPKYTKLMKQKEEQLASIEERRTEAELLKARGGAPMPATTLTHERSVRTGQQPEQQTQPPPVQIPQQ